MTIRFLLLCCLFATATMQAQVYKTVNCTAGALTNLLTGTEKTTVTDLTLTGVINSEDFSTMNGMPALLNIDMSAVTVAASSGNLANAIPNFAFSSKISLKSILFPNSVTTIGNSSFARCSSLISVTIPNLVITIGSFAFQSCSKLTSVKIPNSMTTIGQNAFQGCSGLTSVNIPNSATSIGSYAFDGCSGLSSVTIPNSMTNIGNYAFRGFRGVFNVDEGNQKYLSQDGVLYSKDQTTIIQCPTFKTGTFEIPSTATSTGHGAFYNCSGLSSVIIPNSVTFIENSVFEGCNGLTSVDIPASVTYIGNYAFSYCGGLTSVTIPNSVTTIGSFAFFYCKGLSSFTIPNLVTSIESYGFCNCSGLSSVTIPNSVTTIGYYAFGNCSGLTAISLPNSVTVIGSSAFAGCSGLTSVTIPNTVTSIGENAFQDCSGLTSISATAKTPIKLFTNSGVFSNVNKTTCTLYVPIGSKSAYQAAFEWKDFLNIVEKANVAIEKTEVEPSRLFYANHQLTIMGVAQPNARAMLYSLDGKMVSEHTLQQNQNVVNLPHLSPGIYMVNIQDGTTRYSSKILVNN